VITAQFVVRRRICCKTMQARNHNGYTIISIGKDENRFNPTFVANLNNTLDNLEKGTKGLVFTAEGKYGDLFHLLSRFAADSFSS
jgi:hypothetical protein